MNLQILIISQFDSLITWDVTSYNAVDLETVEIDRASEQGGQNGTANFELDFNLIPSVVWSAMLPLNKRIIEIYNLDAISDPYLFTGQIEVAEKAPIHGAKTKMLVSCVDDKALLDTTVIRNEEYNDTTDYHILTSMLGDYFPSYFNISSVQTLGEVAYFHSQLETAAEFIRRLRGEVGANFYIAPGKRIHWYYTEDLPALFRYDESGTTPSNTASVRPYKIEKYLHDTSGMITRVYVVGAQVALDTTPFKIGSEPPITVASAGGLPATYQISNHPLYNIASFQGAIYGYGGSPSLKPRIWQWKNGSSTPLASATPNTSQMIYATTGDIIYSTISVPGPKIVAYMDYNGRDNEGNVVKHVTYLFAPGRVYHVTIGDYQLKIEDWAIYSGHPTEVRIIVYGGIGNDTVWIGDGWPILIDRSTGKITYLPDDADAIFYPGEVIGDALSYRYYEVGNAIATYEPSRTTYGGDLAGGDPDGGDRYFDLVIKDDKITDLATAKARARAELLARANGVKQGTFTTLYGEGLFPGMNVRLTSTQFGFDEHFLISRMNLKTVGPGEYDGNVQPVVLYTFDFGDYSPELADLLSKLSRQQDDSMFDGTIVFGDETHYSTLDRTYYGVPTSIYGVSKYTG
jgi:hypothetical protein